MTEGGHLGLAPRNAVPGDRVVILIGGQVPYILRATGDHHITLVGEAYVHGRMNGEALEGHGETEVFEIW